MQRETSEQVAAKQAGKADVVCGASELTEGHGGSGDRGHGRSLAAAPGSKTLLLGQGVDRAAREEVPDLDNVALRVLDVD
jgi:hypothetical protein